MDLELSADDKTILVAGGAGYVGSHACKLLAAEGYTPVVVDNLSTGHRWAVQWGEFEEGDIRNAEWLEQIFIKYQPIAVMHFAAMFDVAESVSKPDVYYNNNVIGTMTLLDVMQKCSVRHLIFSSTCSTYGSPVTIPLDESHPQQPINPYGMSKLIAERMMADYAKASELKFVALRYFNAAGADPEALIGEAHEPESHLIPIALDVASGRREKISIFGNDYDTPDGTCIRDYIHVDDLAQAHLLAMNHLINGGESQFLNLGNEQGVSVRDVIASVKKVTACPIEIEEVEKRPGDPDQLISDSSLARKILGWQPARSGIDVLIEDAWRWHQKHFKSN